jgi:hypothetical protein
MWRGRRKAPPNWANKQLFRHTHTVCRSLRELQSSTAGATQHADKKKRQHVVQRDMRSVPFSCFYYKASLLLHAGGLDGPSECSSASGMVCSLPRLLESPTKTTPQQSLTRAEAMPVLPPPTTAEALTRPVRETAFAAPPTPQELPLKRHRRPSAPGTARRRRLAQSQGMAEAGADTCGISRRWRCAATARHGVWQRRSERLHVQSERAPVDTLAAP